MRPTAASTAGSRRRAKGARLLPKPKVLVAAVTTLRAVELTGVASGAAESSHRHGTSSLSHRIRYPPPDDRSASDGSRAGASRRAFEHSRTAAPWPGVASPPTCSSSCSSVPSSAEVGQGARAELDARAYYSGPDLASRTIHRTTKGKAQAMPTAKALITSTSTSAAEL